MFRRLIAVVLPGFLASSGVLLEDKPVRVETRTLRTGHRRFRKLRKQLRKLGIRVPDLTVEYTVTTY
jgi:uncharacterized protein with GYD domain